LAEIRGKVYLEGCGRQRALSFRGSEKTWCWLVSFLCWSLTALPFGLERASWSVFRASPLLWGLLALRDFNIATV
jgi:hypothetical protein